VLNCLLSFCYALLIKDLVAVCLGVGLDPYLGFLHRPRFGRPALALDLAEEFRPLIAESTVIGLLNNGEVNAKHFTHRAGAVTLTRDGRKKVIQAYERRKDVVIKHPTFGYRISYRRVLDVQARILAAVMLGELPHYTPTTTR
jgi:CRISP-associated protein Cas1